MATYVVSRAMEGRANERGFLFGELVKRILKSFCEKKLKPMFRDLGGKRMVGIPLQTQHAASVIRAQQSLIVTGIARWDRWRRNINDPPFEPITPT